MNKIVSKLAFAVLFVVVFLVVNMVLDLIFKGGIDTGEIGIQVLTALLAYAFYCLVGWSIKKKTE